jgi:peptide/nickel transport system substrate-binding protein
VNIFLFLLLAFLLVSCNYPPDTDQTEPQNTESFQSLLPASTITPSPVPARVLTICLGYEPASLFLYGDTSQAALAVRQAIYDGPMDVLGFEYSPVILEKTPSFADGDVFFEPIQVSAGDLIVDAQGNLVQLAEGVTFLSTGCGDDTCAQTYSGQEPVQMDGLVVHYKLRQDILWSDAQQVTAGDSQYSFEIATSIFPQVRSDLITLTQVFSFASSCLG